MFEYPGNSPLDKETAIRIAEIWNATRKTDKYMVFRFSGISLLEKDSAG